MGLSLPQITARCGKRMLNLISKRMSTNEELDQLERLNQRMRKILRRLDQIENPDKAWTDNTGAEEFLGVSSRTLQTYRNEGLIAFSQVASKIWYKLSDLQEFLQRHRQAAK